MNSGMSLLDFARMGVRRAAKPGGLVVDATAGNGRDTLFLADLVGPEGLVLAFDILPEALEATRALLAREGLLARVRLFLAGHENLALCLSGNSVPPPLTALAAGFASVHASDPERYLRGATGVGAAMFNLGFLPGSDKEIVTRPSTTLAALNGLLPLLLPEAVVSVHCYSGHDGGREEGESILSWARNLTEKVWRVFRCDTFNKGRGAENLLLIERRWPGQKI